ncbi:MAG: hypothetical protein BGN91_13915 [Nitrobacter sp. 62-13]|nr:MAG: hypothetical protein BGN91_13915 [Nitrobacter sp. 62-13]
MLQPVIRVCLQVFLPQPVDDILIGLSAQSVDQNPRVRSPTIRESGTTQAEIINQIRGFSRIIGGRSNASIQEILE